MPTHSVTCWAEIDLAALRANVALLRRQAAPVDVAAVVKADAYGHGAVPIARAALEAGAASLCVFTVPEAVELREAGVAAPILAMGPVLPDDHDAVARHGIEAVADSARTATQLSEAAQAAGRSVRIHLNLDSGMQRYGLPHDDAVALAETVRSLPGLELAAAFTHFPDAAHPERSAALDACDRFSRTADQIGAPARHAAASSAIFHLPESAFDYVRAGIALYGIDPAPRRNQPEAAQLQPVLSWRAAVTAVRDVPAGESVSYGSLWTATRDSRIGVVGVGYADGLARGLSPGGEMLVRGQRAPIRGAVCMDCTMIDLTDIPEVQPGDTATIIGTDGANTITAWRIAEQLGTIPYEACTGIAARVERHLVDNPIRS